MFTHILLALDGSDGSARAIPFLSELATPSETQLDVVLANEHLMGRAHGPVNPAVEEDIAKVQATVDSLRQDGWKAEFHVVVCMAGAAAHEISDFAKSRGCDVIVTGTRGHSPWAGALVGSVTQRLLHLAPCPVFVVPSGADQHDSATTSAAQEQTA